MKKFLFFIVIWFFLILGSIEVFSNGYTGESHSKTVIVDKNGGGDFIDIQNALNSLSSSGGTVLIREGVYDVSSWLTIPASNITIEGVGPSTVLRPVDNFDGNVIYSIGWNNISIRNLKIDGNAANQSQGNGIIIRNALNVYIENLRLYNIKSNALLIETYNGQRINNIHISNNTLSHCGTHCLVFNNATNIFATRNRIYECGNSCIQLYTTSNFVVNSNIINNASNNFAGVRSAETTTDGVISSNIINNSDRGIHIVSGSGRININDNIIYESNLSGILIQDASVMNIANNMIKNSGDSEQLEAAGIYLSNVTSSVINGNTILDDQVSPTQSYGILETDTSDFNIITGNMLRNNEVSNLSSIGANTLYSINNN